MIHLTRINHIPLVLNSDQIEHIEATPDTVISLMNGHSAAVVRESADLLYNLVVLWVASSVHPKDVWTEMERRERLLGIAEKLPKERLDASPRRKVVPLDRTPLRKPR